MADIFNCYFVDSIKLLNNNDHVEDVIESRRYSDVWEIFEKIEKTQLYIIVWKLKTKAGTEEGKCRVVEVGAEKNLLCI